MLMLEVLALLFVLLSGAPRESRVVPTLDKPDDTAVMWRGGRQEPRSLTQALAAEVHLNNSAAGVF